MRNNSGGVVGSFGFKRAGPDAGGYVTGLQISNDGKTRACNTDVNGAFVWGENDTQWRQLFSSETLPVADYDPRPVNPNVDYPSGFAVAVAPSDKTRIYGGYNGFFYVSSDTGISLTRCALAAKAMRGNSGQQRHWNDKIAVHPSNPNIALFGTSNDGVYYTTNAGAAMAAVTATGGLPANAVSEGQPTPYLVAFDPGNPLNCYIAVQGTGVYRSTTGVTGSFVLMAGSPTSVAHLLVDATGDIWATNRTQGAANGLARFTGSSWALVSHPIPQGVLSIAVDPANTNRVTICAADPVAAHSIDRGATWVGGEVWQGTWPPPRGFVFTDTVEWLNDNENWGWYPGKLLYDPATPNRLWGTHGVGIAYSTPPASFTPWQWTGVSRGIYELVASGALSVPGRPGVVHLACWDKPFWRVTDLDSAAKTPKWTDANAPDVDHAWQIDYAADDPDYLVAAAGKTIDSSAVSTNGGLTWSRVFPSGFPSGQAGGNGGACAVNTKLQQIIIPGNDQKAVMTLDGWTTWSYLDPEGTNPSGKSGWINAAWTRRRCVTADKTRAGVFAVMMKGGDYQGPNVHGLWVRNPGTGQWTRTVPGRQDSNPTDSVDYWDCTLCYIPGKPGELIYTAGMDSEESWNSRLLHYTGDGATTAKVPLGAAWNVGGISTFGFGKSAPGQSYPAVFFHGKVNGVRGYYASFDFFATQPILLARFPAGEIVTPQSEVGDLNRFGRFYMGFGNSAFIYGDYADAATGY